MKDFWLKFKKWIIGFFICGVCLAGGLGAKPVKIPDDLKLKCPEDKIIESKEIDWIIEKEDGTFENKGKIKSYDYISGEKAIGKFRFKDGNFYTNVKIIKETAEENIDHFYTGDHFYKDKQGEIFEIEHGATTTIDAFNEQTKIDVLSKIKNLFAKNAFADTVSYYAGAGDGRVGLDNSSSWSTTRGATTGNQVGYASSPATVYVYKGTNYALFRGFIPVDTSALPDGATITGADFYQYFSATGVAGDGYDNVHLIQTTQALDTELVVADYNQIGSTEGASSKAISGLSTSAYTTWALNATGLTWVSKTSYTNLGIRGGYDFTNHAVGQGHTSNHSFYTSEETGTNKDPYLSVTYSEAAAAPVRKKANQPQFFMP